jgi:hypothetical protein
MLKNGWVDEPEHVVAKLDVQPDGGSPLPESVQFFAEPAKRKPGRPPKAKP